LPGIGPFGNLLGDVSGIATDAADECRGGRSQTDEPQEVETRCAWNDTTIVPRITICCKDGQVDPAKVRSKAGAPDHVRHFKGAAVIEETFRRKNGPKV
jgi:hypothetical protein